MLKAKKSQIPLPKEEEDKKSNVLKWGKYNEYPYYLKYLAGAESIHGGIVKSKVHYTVSGGLEYNGPNETGYKAFFKNKKKNHKDKNLFELVKCFSQDFEKSNMFVARVIFNLVGDQVYQKMELIPFERVRFEIEIDDNQNVILTGNICVSKDWTESNPDYEILEPYRPGDKEQKKCFVMHMEETGEHLIPNSKGELKKDINPGFYPSPTYDGAITDIDTLIQIGIYNNSEIHNGFSLGTLIYLANGQPPNDQDKKQLEMDLEASSTGGLQAGRSMVVYGNGQDGKPHVENLQGNNLPDRYQNVKKNATDSVVYAHEVVVPTLFGIKQEGSFNASELETGFAIMNANYFESRRQAILSIVNFVMNEIAGIEGEISFGEVTLNLPKDEERPAFIIEKEKQKSAHCKHEHSEDADVILERLKMRGVDKDKFEILDQFSGHDKTDDQIFEEMKQTFADLNDNEQRALELIEQNQGFNQIRKALDISGRELAKVYQVLIKKGLITSEGEVTTDGRKQIAINDVTSLEIMYEYRLRPDAPDLVPGGKSRDFCSTLMRLNRLYSREDIEMISGVEGYNVFAYRGGWYHNPDTNTNEPGCRHEWSQVVTFGNR